MPFWDAGLRKDSFKVGSDFFEVGSDFFEVGSVFFDVVSDFFEVGSEVGIFSVFGGRCPEAAPDVPRVFGKPLRKSSGSRATFSRGFPKRSWH